MPADSVPGESPLPGLPMAMFLLCPHVLRSVLFLEGHVRTLSNPHYMPKALSPNTIPLGDGVLMHEF